MMDPTVIAKYDSMTPATIDYPTHYDDAAEPMDLQLDEVYGVFPFRCIPSDGTEHAPCQLGENSQHRRCEGCVSHPNNVRAYDQDRPTMRRILPQTPWLLEAQADLGGDPKKRIAPTSC